MTWNPNISETVCHSTINNTTGKCITRPLKCIYVKCFKRLTLRSLIDGVCGIVGGGVENISKTNSLGVGIVGRVVKKWKFR